MCHGENTAASASVGLQNSTCLLCCVRFYTILHYFGICTVYIFGRVSLICISTFRHVYTEYTQGNGTWHSNSNRIIISCRRTQIRRRRHQSGPIPRCATKSTTAAVVRICVFGVSCCGVCVAAHNVFRNNVLQLD